MKDVTTYVGVDAHKKDLFVAMLIGPAKTPETWQLANQPNAVRRLVRKLERESPGPCRSSMKPGRVALRCTAGDDVAGELRRGRARADSAQARGAGENESPRCAQAGGAAAGDRGNHRISA
jgi:hypothetical protein